MIQRGFFLCVLLLLYKKKRLFDSTIVNWQCILSFHYICRLTITVLLQSWKKLLNLLFYIVLFHSISKPQCFLFRNKKILETLVSEMIVKRKFAEGFMLQDAPEFWINREDYLEERIGCLSKDEPNLMIL